MKKFLLTLKKYWFIILFMIVAVLMYTTPAKDVFYKLYLELIRKHDATVKEINSINRQAQIAEDNIRVQREISVNRINEQAHNSHELNLKELSPAENLSDEEITENLRRKFNL